VVQLGGEGDPMLILDAPGRVGDTVDGAAATATVEVQGGAGGELQWWVDGALARTDPVDADPWTGALDLAAPAAGETRVRALLVRGGLPRTVTSHLYLRRGADSGAGAGGEADGAAKAGGCGCGGGGAAAGLMGLVAALLAALRRRPAPR
jgi:MYXO-CTERM domain-containing protein